LNKLKVALLSLLVILLSFGAFTLLRFPYDRMVDKLLKGLERNGLRIEYKEIKVEPLSFRASLREAVLRSNLFDLKAESLEARLFLMSFLLNFKLKVELKLSEGSILLPMVQGGSIPFSEGRALLEGYGKGLKVGELIIRGKEITILGEIDGKRYNLRVKPSGSLEKSLSPFLRLLQRDPQGFYILRSEI